MSEFHVNVVRITDDPVDHPNADSLQIVKVFNYPVIVKKNEDGSGRYKAGSLAVYIPVDSVMPNTPEWEYLGKSRRVRAKKIRGVFSMGMLVPAWEGASAGDQAAERLGVKKYEPPQEIPGGQNIEDLGFMPKYTDIEGLRRYPDILVPGEEVVVTEKIHGENARVCFREGKLWVGSRTNIKRDDTGGWWLAVRNSGIEEAVRQFPNLVFYGESHGYTGKFQYGTGKRPAFRCFDIFDSERGHYLNFDAFNAVCKSVSIPTAPVLYRGPFDLATMTALSDGPSTLDVSHTREGVVIRPVAERWDERVGRVILKLHGETFLLSH